MFVKGYVVKTKTYFKEAQIKSLIGKKILANEHSALLLWLFSSSGPFLLRVLQRLTLVLYVEGWLQLFQQSLSRAIITNDSVSGRKLST